MTNRNKQTPKITSAETISEFNKEETTEENIIGIVANCKILNVRKQPSKSSEVLCTVRVSDEVIIDTTKSNENWFNIKTKSNIEGFCMKDFINVKS
ncbi:SH3 domain-containing protein [Anaerostipes sp. PC18]|uniref:SH3 domain-containing protein n=1 Tax=Anaerostipes sp. PC18 TaxID=3036926 RepID=UPI00308CC39F|nr:SH3 domain-containing protein [Anaerostipes sp. PC18]